MTGLVVATLLLGAAPAVAAPAGNQTADAAQETAEDSLLVRFAPGTPADRADLLDEVGAQVGGPAGATGFSVIDPGDRPVEEVRAELEASGLVETVEPNRVRTAATLPNDAWYGTSQAGYLGVVGLPTAWNRTTGTDDLILAILDSGVDLDHPDLVGRLLPGWDIVNDDPVPADDDPSGHGTMVAGIAAARTNNNAGVAGATWAGKVLPVKVLDATGKASDADIAAGITWAVDRGADVINLSLGGPGSSNTLQAAVDYAVSHDVVVVAAAGNDNSSVPHYPAAADGVLSVGATDALGLSRASFSNYGTWVDITAPGVNITSTGTNNWYSLGSGTSFSSPLVAGAAMLLRAADRSASAAVISRRLTSSAVDLGLPGLDAIFGHGLLSAVGALLLTPASTPSATGGRSGYWMLDASGSVFPFGNALDLGMPSDLSPAGTPIDTTDLEPAPGGAGYWVVDRHGAVFGFGSAAWRGNLAPGDLAPGETVTSLSGTPTGRGYWLFTTSGRVFNFGDAPFLGDMRGIALNSPVLDSVPTPTGTGYYMVGSDGGIFAFGDAAFTGSMGGLPLNAPVQSLVPDPDRRGYWLVASDGGVFAFDAPFSGSMGGTALRAPVTGMVSYGNGYLMVATDGGIFNFSDAPFVGSLGGMTLASPIVAVAPLPR